MQGIIPFILIIASLSLIIVIIVRKFPQLVLMDVDNIPEVKENVKKDEYLRKRAIERDTAFLQKLEKYVVKPGIQFLKEMQLAFRKYVGAIQKKAISESQKKDAKEQVAGGVKKRQQIRLLIQEAQRACEEGEYDVAEEKYITVIKKDAKSKEAYQGVGGVYFKQGQLDEAKETYEFLIQLDPGNEEALMRLAEIAEDKGQLGKAVEYYQQAVLINDSIAARFARLSDLLLRLEQPETAIEAIEQALVLEPQNPKYLDNLIEMSIIVGDKKTAEEAYRELRMVNPENQKLSSFKDRIDKIQ